jgi:hypothetical protein
MYEKNVFVSALHTIYTYCEQIQHVAEGLPVVDFCKFFSQVSEKNLGNPTETVLCLLLENHLF